MKVPKPRRMSSGNFYINLRVGGQSVSVTAPTAKECTRQAALLKADMLAGSPRSSAPLTLRQACERYIAKKERSGASPETIRGYTVIMRNRFASLMDRPVTVSAPWQRAYDEDAARLSPKTMATSWSFIRTVCRSECGVTLPEISTVAREQTEHAFLEPEQIRAFVEAVRGDKYQIPLLLCLSSCRMSEALGLRWEDVDLENNQIHIRQTLVRDKQNRPVTKTRTKTPESNRYIPLFIPELRAALEEAADKSGPVVSAAPNTLLRRSDMFCDALGFPRVGLHGLRHSFASLCYSLQVPELITMRLGGWASTRIVHEIYTHLDKQSIGRNVEKLAAFFSGS